MVDQLISDKWFSTKRDGIDFIISIVDPTLKEAALTAEYQCGCQVVQIAWI